MGNDSDKIKDRYNRISKIYNLLEKPMESMSMGKSREELIGKIEGEKILEIGIGTGKGLVHYPGDFEITGIDFSENMIKRSKENLKGKGNISIIEMDAENMDFVDNTFDTVVTSCVFCSVPDAVKGLKEIRRVCKKGGKIVMLEHMRSEKKVVGKLMDITNFIPLNIWGANINRRTIDNLIKAGFHEEDIEHENIWSDIVKLIEIRNNK